MFFLRKALNDCIEQRQKKYNTFLLHVTVNDFVGEYTVYHQISRFWQALDYDLLKKMIFWEKELLQWHLFVWLDKMSCIPMEIYQRVMFYEIDHVE